MSNWNWIKCINNPSMTLAVWSATAAPARVIVRKQRSSSGSKRAIMTRNDSKITKDNHIQKKMRSACLSKKTQKYLIHSVRNRSTQSMTMPRIFAPKIEISRSSSNRFTATRTFIVIRYPYRPANCRRTCLGRSRMQLGWQALI